jgi:hypothetical protein
MKLGKQRMIIGPSSPGAGCLLILVGIVSAGCGGGTSAPPPAPDFSISINPPTLPATVGTVSPAVAVQISAENGFAETVNLVINGLPPGSFSTPPVPLAIPPTGSQKVTLFIPPSTPTGSVSIEFAATSGTLSHNATLNLMVNPVSNTAVLQESSGQVAAGTIEIQGVSAGNFNPTYWQQNTLHWLPDVREPMFTALTTSPYQNIYAPWPLSSRAGGGCFTSSSGIHIPLFRRIRPSRRAKNARLHFKSKKVEPSIKPLHYRQLRPHGNSTTGQ